MPKVNRKKRGKGFVQDAARAFGDLIDLKATDSKAKAFTRGFLSPLTIAKKGLTEVVSVLKDIGIKPSDLIGIAALRKGTHQDSLKAVNELVKSKGQGKKKKAAAKPKAKPKAKPRAKKGGCVTCVRKRGMGWNSLNKSANSSDLVAIPSF